MALRETVAIDIHAEGWNGGEEWADVHPVKQDNYRQQADAAIAALSEALLSEAAIEAAAVAHYRANLVPSDVPDEIVKQSEKWLMGRDRYYMPEARAALQAALAALQHADAPVE